MGIKLSILDQSPVFDGESFEQAFQHTLEMAQLAEKLGYHRFWVSEHHDSDRVAGSSPEVLIAHLLAKTERIRIGSGGVMLQHYSPYKVAENFNVLASLAPGRVDLGVGRAPGGLPRSTRALQKGISQEPSLSEKLGELQQFIQNRFEEGHPFEGVRACPIPQQPADIYVLGTSINSAELAAEKGLSYVFAQFINGNEAEAREAIKMYRDRFSSAFETQPQAMLALSVIVAETEDAAETLAGSYKNVKVHLESGKTVTLGTVEQAEEFGRQSQQEYSIEVQDAQVTKGTKESIRQQLLGLQQSYGVDEFIVVSTAIKNFQQRVRSYVLLKQAFAD